MITNAYPLSKKHRRNKKSTQHRALTKAELTIIAYIATLILAAIAILVKVDASIAAAVFGFLGVAIGALMGNLGGSSGGNDDAKTRQ